MFIHSNIRKLPVTTSAQPHIRIFTPALYVYLALRAFLTAYNAALTVQKLTYTQTPTIC